MKDVKDIFSRQADNYLAYRPEYPEALFNFLYSLSKNFVNAWDCGTGNGQVAKRLSERFDHVYATDISERQIANAYKIRNITYKIVRAELTPFEDDFFDLITIGTALHWFDFGAFYKEVKRVGKNGSFIAAWGYAPFRAEPSIDAILDDFYYNIIYEYWDPERKYVDEQYKTIPFPFEEITTPELEIKSAWTKDQFIGFLHSWSSVQHYINKNAQDPVTLIAERLDKEWPDGDTKQVTFPLFMRVGKIVK